MQLPVEALGLQLRANQARSPVEGEGVADREWAYKHIKDVG